MVESVAIDLFEPPQAGLNHASAGPAECSPRLLGH